MIKIGSRGRFDYNNKGTAAGTSLKLTQKHETKMKILNLKFQLLQEKTAKPSSGDATVRFCIFCFSRDKIKFIRFLSMHVNI